MKTMNDMRQVGERELRRLAYIKALFRIGIDQLEKGTEPNTAQALLTFDNCVEMMLWLLADFHGIRIRQKKQDIPFPELLSLVNDEMRKRNISRVLPSYGSDLQELHLARNNVQHHGIVPSISTVQRYRVVAESILVGSAEDSLKLSWGDISMALLISDLVVRELYSRAEKEYENQKYLEAALSLIAAFECMKAKEIDRRAGSGIFLTRAFAEAAGEKSSDPHIKALSRYAKAIEGEVEILKLGLDYKGFQRYRDFTQTDPLDHITISVKEEDPAEVLTVVKNEFGSKVGLKETDAELQEWLVFAFGFVIDSILRWQLISRAGVVESFIRSLGRAISDAE